MKLYDRPKNKQWGDLLRRPADHSREIDEVVQKIIASIKEKGDSELLALTQRFDHWTPDRLAVSEKDIELAAQEVDQELRSAILLAKSNIEKFHAAQLETPQPIETSEGIRCWRKPVAIQRVGLYIPGGSAPLISTLLMLGIPATLAGCQDIVVCTPAMNGQIHPAILYTASLLGIRKIFKAGGAQAVAAMAFGTETVPSVHKIFGPGNRFVTRAKQLVSQEGIAIDMPAGPSEVVVFADDTCVPSFVASDLLSQAEHGVDSQVLLVTISKEVAGKVMAELELQKKDLPRTREINGALEHSSCIVLDDVPTCFKLINEYAPEHLIIASTRPDDYVEYIVNAGSVFLGNYAPESAGDYVSGPNHTLPTSGYAKSYSGVSVESFIKKITFQKLTPGGLETVKDAIVSLAMAEQLTAHAQAVLKRFE